MLEDNYESCWSTCNDTRILLCIYCLGNSMEWLDDIYDWIVI